jgi:hypothetical protein
MHHCGCQRRQTLRGGDQPLVFIVRARMHLDRFVVHVREDAARCGNAAMICVNPAWWVFITTAPQ